MFSVATSKSDRDCVVLGLNDDVWRASDQLVTTSDVHWTGIPILVTSVIG